MPRMTVEEWDLRFFAKHSPTEIERAVYQRRLLEYLNEKDPLQASFEEFKKTGKPTRIKAVTKEDKEDMVLGPFGFVKKDEL